MLKCLALVFAIVGLTLSQRANAANITNNALEWLAKHQEPDGHWDSCKYGAKTKTDTATTGLALIAFLNAGHSEKLGEYKSNVKRAVAWMKSKQSSNGRFFDPTDSANSADEATANAIGTMCICDAAAMANMPDTRAFAQKAVDYCTQVYPLAQGELMNGHGSCTLDSSVNTPIVGWYVMALKSAKIAGIKVPHTAFDALISYLDSVEHTVVPQRKNEIAPPRVFWFRPKEPISVEHPIHRLCALACMSRQYTGWGKEDLEKSVEHFVDMSLPSWEAGGENVDVLYWYLGSICTFQQGGDIWKNWNSALTSALLKNQIRDGDNNGSWDAIGFAGEKWGRVGQTAVGCFCTEVYYAYQLPNPLVEERKEKFAQ